ncbi:MAG: hypothetical protein Q7V63_03920 [Gammaproteobacteria bacterium]|nr:hypothetical protein [Gammaproteobacteria bacterium]
MGEFAEILKAWLASFLRPAITEAIPETAIPKTVAVNHAAPVPPFTPKVKKKKAAKTKSKEEVLASTIILPSPEREATDEDLDTPWEVVGATKASSAGSEGRASALSTVMLSPVSERGISSPISDTSPGSPVALLNEKIISPDTRPLTPVNYANHLASNTTITKPQPKIILTPPIAEGLKQFFEEIRVQLALITLFIERIHLSSLSKSDKSYFTAQSNLHKKAVLATFKTLKGLGKSPDISLSDSDKAKEFIRLKSIDDPRADFYSICMKWNLALNLFARTLSFKGLAVSKEELVADATLHGILQSHYFFPTPVNSIPAWYVDDLKQYFNLYLVGSTVLHEPLFYRRRALREIATPLVDAYSDIDYVLIPTSAMSFKEMFDTSKHLAEGCKETPFNTDEGWISFKNMSLAGSAPCDVTVSSQSAIDSVMKRKLYLTAAMQNVVKGTVVMPHRTMPSVFTEAVIGLDFIEVKASSADLSPDDIAFMFKTLCKLNAFRIGAPYTLPEVFHNVMENKALYWPVLQEGLSRYFAKYFEQRPAGQTYDLFEHYQLFPCIIEQVLGKKVKLPCERSAILENKAGLIECKQAFQFLSLSLSSYGLDASESAKLCKALKVYPSPALTYAHAFHKPLESSARAGFGGPGFKAFQAYSYPGH